MPRYQEKLEEKMENSYFVIESVDLLFYSLHKTRLRKGGSYIESPEWLRSKRATVNPKNKKDDKCFQYALTVALNHQNIGRDPQRISKIKPFISQYNWKDTDFQSHQKDRKNAEQEDLEKLFKKNTKIIDWKKFEQNNKTIALNIFFVPHYNRKRENQVILLMITDSETWHYLAKKNFPALPRGITSNHHGDFYCSNCFHSYRTDNKLKNLERLCNNHDYCHAEMPTDYNEILKYNHGKKSLKAPFIIYLDLECLLKKKQSWKSYTESKAKQEPSGLPMFTKCSFGETKNKFDEYRERNFIKKLCEKLRDRTMD